MYSCHVLSRASACRIAPYFRSMQYRTLSDQGNKALLKLRGVLEEYRQQNYRQCLPSRFKKDLLREAKQMESDQISMDGMFRVIQNIGASDRLSKEELAVIFREVGCKNGEISVSEMGRII